MNWQILDEQTICELLPDAAARQCCASDFAKLLGACCYGNGMSFWWLATANDSPNARAIDYDGDLDRTYPNGRPGVVRPALLYSEIESICTTAGFAGANTAARVQVGDSFETDLEYPTTVPGKKISDFVLASWDNLPDANRTVTVDSVPPQYEQKNYNQGFTPRVLQAKEHNGKKYVKLSAFAYNEYVTINRDGQDEKVIQGQEYVVEYEKVKFIRLKNNQGTEYALLETPPFSGIQLDLQQDYNKQNYRSGDKIDMQKHNLGRYLENHFAKDIGTTKEALERIQAEKAALLAKLAKEEEHRKLVAQVEAEWPAIKAKLERKAQERVRMKMLNGKKDPTAKEER